MEVYRNIKTIAVQHPEENTMCNSEEVEEEEKGNLFNSSRNIANWKQKEKLTSNVNKY